MKELQFGTFFGKSIVMKLEDTDDEVWFKKRMDEWQSKELKERDEYQKLKLKEDMDFIFGKNADV